MGQLGGQAVYLCPEEVGLTKRESVKDVAQNLSRWVDAVMARVCAHQTVMELAENASVPVINGLSDFEHPCQALADYLTLLDTRGPWPAKLSPGWATVTTLPILSFMAPQGWGCACESPRLRVTSRTALSWRRPNAKVEIYCVMHDPARPSPARTPFTPMFGSSLGQGGRERILD